MGGWIVYSAVGIFYAGVCALIDYALGDPADPSGNAKSEWTERAVLLIPRTLLWPLDLLIRVIRLFFESVEPSDLLP